MKLGPKHVYLGLVIVLLLSGFSVLPVVKTEEVKSNGNITFQPNSIPDVDVIYNETNYSFDFWYKSFFIRVRPFVIYNETYYGMKKIINFIKTQYPDINYKWLVEKATDAIHYGFNLTKLPQKVADKIDYLGFRLVDLNFPKRWMTLDTFEVDMDEEGEPIGPYNVTHIRIEKANLILSFEDLYPYGYSVEHINSTCVLIGNVKGRIDLIVDPIVESGSRLVVTGTYTDIWEDMYDADNTGNLQLLASTDVTTTETRQFLRSVHIDPINGLNAHKLDPIIPGGPGVYPYIIGNDTLLTGYWGIRVWKRIANGSETELTSGVPVAQVNRSTATDGYQSATWNCPETDLISTDAIIARFYLKIDGLINWTNVQDPNYNLDWITEQLGAYKLVGVPWTVYYYTVIVLEAGDYWYLIYSSITSTYETRIENFQWIEAENISLTQQVRPADDLALKLNLTITNLLISGNTTITGLDKDGGSQTEDITITANTTYTTTLWWNSVSNLECYGAYTIEVNQSRWGLVWKQGDNQYWFNVSVQIGDASTSTTVSATNDHVEIGDSTNNNGLTVTSSATLNLGTSTTPQDGGSIIINGGGATGAPSSERWYGTTNFYGVQLIKTTLSWLELYGTDNWENCVVTGTGKISFKASSATFTNVFLEYINPASSNYAFTDCVFETSSNGGEVLRVGSSYDVDVQDSTLINNHWNGYEIQCWGDFTGTLNVTDCTTDPARWNWRSGANGVTNHQFTFNLKTIFSNNTGIQNANVTIWDLNGTQIFTELADVNGEITEKTLIASKFTGEGTETVYSPYNLTITYGSYQTYTENFTLSAKTDWTIALQESSVAVTYTSAILVASLFLLIPIIAVIFVWRWRG